VRDLDEQFAEWRIGLDDVREVGDQVTDEMGNAR
jgi:hypothetical protein